MARDYFSFPPPTPLSLSLSPSTSSRLIVSSIQGFLAFASPRVRFPSLFPFALFPSLPRKSLPPRGNDPLCTRGPRIRDKINRGKEEPVNAVPSLMLFFILTLRQTLISGSGFFGRKNRAVFIDVLGERNAFPSNASSFLELARRGTRVTFFVFSFFFFSSSFFREINPLSQLIRWFFFRKGISVSEMYRRNFFWFKE